MVHSGYPLKPLSWVFVWAGCWWNQHHSFLRNYPCYLDTSPGTRCHFYTQLTTRVRAYSRMMVYIRQRWTCMHLLTCTKMCFSLPHTHARAYTDTCTITHSPPCFISSTDSSNEFLLCVRQLAPTQGDFSDWIVVINHNPGQHSAITCGKQKCIRGGNGSTIQQRKRDSDYLKRQR